MFVWYWRTCTYPGKVLVKLARSSPGNLGVAPVLACTFPGKHLGKGTMEKPGNRVTKILPGKGSKETLGRRGFGEPPGKRAVAADVAKRPPGKWETQAGRLGGSRQSNSWDVVSLRKAWQKDTLARKNLANKNEMAPPLPDPPLSSYLNA